MQIISRVLNAFYIKLNSKSDAEDGILLVLNRKINLVIAAVKILKRAQTYMCIPSV